MAAYQFSASTSRKDAVTVDTEAEDGAALVEVLVTWQPGSGPGTGQVIAALRAIEGAILEASVG
ncbi:MAG: hypothetical protein WD341_01845 [Tistlia sp.]|uniref:hypothetical protein n=1 Tax=Tistlia sp. TaxID=3057121 RepID=UPI0034A561C7